VFNRVVLGFLNTDGKVLPFTLYLTGRIRLMLIRSVAVPPVNFAEPAGHSRAHDFACWNLAYCGVSFPVAGNWVLKFRAAACWYALLWLVPVPQTIKKAAFRPPFCV